MRNAWMLILAPVTLGLVACGNPPMMTTPDTGFIEVHDSGVDAGPPRDTGPGHDASMNDANIPGYDGGAAFTCTGLTAVMPSGYCAAYADAYVAEYMRCGLLGASGATELHAALVAGCDVSGLQAAITAGHATWDPAMAACCLAHSAHDTSCFYNPGGGAAECDFIHGTVANGSPCANGAECMNGYCHFTDSCMGTCTAFAATGTVCNLGDVTCAPDATCDTSSHRCTTQTGVAGTPCSAANHTGCLPTIACVDPDGDGEGVCNALPTRGQGCTSDNILCDLNSSICDYDFGSMSGYCTPAFEIGTMRCIIDAQCTGDAYCRGASFGAMTYGTCTARAHRGQSCMVDKCVDGLICRPDHTCGDQPHLGDTCTAASGCDNSQCAGGGTCVALYPGGMHCTMNSQCASGNCNPATSSCTPDCP